MKQKYFDGSKNIFMLEKIILLHQKNIFTITKILLSGAEVLPGAEAG